MTDGRLLIKKAADELNNSKLLNFNVDVSSIDTSSNEELSNVINYFLDSVETVPERKEHMIPKYVISVYNSIVDNAVSFETSENVPFNIDEVVYKRTKFPV